MDIIVKKFPEHYNRALGKQITSRRQYEQEMKRQNMVPQDKGDDIARRSKERSHKDYKVDPETRKFFSEVRSSSKNGKIQLSGRQLDYMKKVGVTFNRPDYKGLKGGMD